jgi:TRIAD3 protein (E3 ubiquitin-protein ligase RNF216)
MVEPLAANDESTWWFLCQNQDCNKTSCRKCKGAYHYGKSCEASAQDEKGKGKEAAKTASKAEKAAMLRKHVEEAMTQAAVRACNKCKAPFVKEFGCNSMTCASCGNEQCYSCNQNVSHEAAYGNWHWGAESEGKCVLFENTASQRENDSKKAEKEAIQKVLKEHPELDPKSLEVKFSDRVKRDEALGEEDYERGLRQIVCNPFIARRPRRCS